MVELKEPAVGQWLRQKLLEKQASGQHFSQLRLIVEVEPGYMEDVQASLRKLDVRVVDKAFNFVRVEAPPQLIDEIARIPGVKRVTYDMPVKALALPAPAPPLLVMKDPLIGDVRISEVEVPPEKIGPDLFLPFSPARALFFWQYSFIPTSKVRELLVDKPELGLTGEGVKLAVLDTGADSPDHFQLRGRIRHYSTCIMDPMPHDGCGHGMHCITIASGYEWAFLPFGKVVGIAPEAERISVKVLSSAGTGSMMDVIKGMELAMKLGAKVVSMSLGSEECQGCYEPDGDETMKPDCVSFGGGRAEKGLKPDELIYSGISVGWLDGLYSGFKHRAEGLHGTSMATPAVSGLMALWLQAKRIANVSHAKRILAERGLAKNKDVGWGLVKLSWAF